MSTTREFKGIRVNDFPIDYTIIDLETTGFIPGKDKIIEFAAIKVRNGVIVDEIQQLFNPEISISSTIKKITGINDDTVINAPLIENKLKNLIDWVGDDIVVGHNVNFDIDFLYDECIRVLNQPFANDYFDTLYVCKELYPETSHKLIDMLSALGLSDDGTHHRALSDCRDTYRLICKLKTKPEIKTIIKPTPSSRLFTPKPSKTTQSLQALKEMIGEITCDSVVTEQELFRLKEWLSENESLAGNYPYDVIASAINGILEDGIIEQTELNCLLKILKEQLDPVENKCCHKGCIDFNGKCVCLSGDFVYGSKSEYAERISSCGAVIVNTITKKTDVLIVGGEGSDKWCNGNYGTKVKKAIEMQEKGHRIIIIKESDVKI